MSAQMKFDAKTGTVVSTASNTATPLGGHRLAAVHGSSADQSGPGVGWVEAAPVGVTQRVAWLSRA